jgi:hypothetical protein
MQDELLEQFSGCVRMIRKINSRFAAAEIPENRRRDRSNFRPFDGAGRK